MLRFTLAAAGFLAAGCGVAGAQLALPDAVPAPAASPAAPAANAPEAPKADRTGPGFVSEVAAVVGRPLKLDGARGQLVFSGRGKVLRIDKFSLPGEVISDPSRKCLIDIVAEAPIETKSLDRPDGLARYEAAIPACPFVFDLLDGAVLVAQQNAACVFQAADCQASPSGLWGPGSTELGNDAKAIERDRTRANAAAERSLRALETKLKGKPEAADVAREQSDAAQRREEVCRDYEQEAVYGYCASRLAQARAAWFKARLDALARRPAAED
jgi:hypothetical protein